MLTQMLAIKKLACIIEKIQAIAKAIKETKQVQCSNGPPVLRLTSQTSQN